MFSGFHKHYQRGEGEGVQPRHVLFSNSEKQATVGYYKLLRLLAGMQHNQATRAIRLVACCQWFSFDGYLQLLPTMCDNCLMQLLITIAPELC
jgi:hypothetical protein